MDQLCSLNIKLVSYADDFAVYGQSNNIESISNDILIYLESLCTFLQQRDLKVSVGKCSTTLFSPWNEDFKQKPSIKVNNTTLEVKKNSKILGIAFDNGLNGGAHISTASSKARNCVNILKALSGASWGQQKETIVNSYKAFVRPVLEYACPV